MPRIKPYTLEYDAPRTCNTPIKLPRDTWQQTFSTSEPIISHHITPVHEVKCSIRRTPTTYLHGSTPKTVARPVALSVVNGRRMPRSLLYLLSSAKEEPPASHQEECHFRNPSQNSIEVAPIIHCPGPSVDHPLSWEDRYKFISEITSVFLGSHEIIENCMRRSIDRYSDRKGLMRGYLPIWPLRHHSPYHVDLVASGSSVYNHLLRTVPHEAFTVSTLTGENMKEDLTYIEKKVAEVKHLNESIKASFQKLYNKSYQTAIGMWPNWCDVAFDLTYGVRANILPYLTPIQTNTYCFDNLDEWSRAVDVMSSIYVKWNTCCEREKGGLNEAMRDIEAPHFKLFTVLPEAQSSDPAIYQIQAEPHPVTSMPYENLQQIADFTKCWVDICVQRQMEAIQLSEERERNNIRLSSDEEIESALYHFREAYKLQRGLSKDASVYYGGTFGLSNGATKVSCAIRTPTSYLKTETTITSLPKHHPSVIVDKSNDNITIPSTVQSILDISCTQLSKVDIVYNNMGALNLFLDGDISVKEMLSYSVTRDLWLSELIWSHMTVRTPSPNSTHYLLSTESDGRMSIDIMQTLEGCCESPAKEKSVISGILPFNCHVLSSFVNSDLIKKGSFVVLSVFEQDLLIQFHKFLLNFSTNSLSCSAAYASEVGDMYGRICDDSINRRAILSDRRIACSKKSKLLRLQHKKSFMNISLSDIEDTSKLIVEGPTREWARVKEWFNELAQEYETPHKWNESNKEPPPVGLARWIGVGSESSLASVPEFAREMRQALKCQEGEGTLFTLGFSPKCFLQLSQQYIRDYMSEFEEYKCLLKKAISFLPSPSKEVCLASWTIRIIFSPANVQSISPVSYLLSHSIDEFSKETNKQHQDSHTPGNQIDTERELLVPQKEAHREYKLHRHQVDSPLGLDSGEVFVERTQALKQLFDPDLKEVVNDPLSYEMNYGWSPSQDDPDTIVKELKKTTTKESKTKNKKVISVKRKKWMKINEEEEKLLDEVIANKERDEKDKEARQLKIHRLSDTSLSETDASVTEACLDIIMKESESLLPSRKGKLAQYSDFKFKKSMDFIRAQKSADIEMNRHLAFVISKRALELSHEAAAFSKALSPLETSTHSEFTTNYFFCHWAAVEYAKSGAWRASSHDSITKKKDSPIKVVLSDDGFFQVSITTAGEPLDNFYRDRKERPPRMLAIDAMRNMGEDPDMCFKLLESRGNIFPLSSVQQSLIYAVSSEIYLGEDHITLTKELQATRLRQLRYANKCLSDTISNASQHVKHHLKIKRCNVNLVRAVLQFQIILEGKILANDSSKNNDDENTCAELYRHHIAPGLRDSPLHLCVAMAQDDLLECCTFSEQLSTKISPSELFKSLLFRVLTQRHSSMLSAITGRFVDAIEHAYLAHIEALSFIKSLKPCIKRAYNSLGIDSVDTDLHLSSLFVANILGDLIVSIYDCLQVVAMIRTMGWCNLNMKITELEIDLMNIALYIMSILMSFLRKELEAAGARNIMRCNSALEKTCCRIIDSFSATVSENIESLNIIHGVGSDFKFDRQSKLKAMEEGSLLDFVHARAGCKQTLLSLCQERTRDSNEKNHGTVAHWDTFFECDQSDDNINLQSLFQDEFWQISLFPHPAVLMECGSEITPEYTKEYHSHFNAKKMIFAAYLLICSGKNYEASQESKGIKVTPLEFNSLCSICQFTCTPERHIILETIYNVTNAMAVSKDTIRILRSFHTKRLASAK